MNTKSNSNETETILRNITINLSPFDGEGNPEASPEGQPSQNTFRTGKDNRLLARPRLSAQVTHSPQAGQCQYAVAGE